jgi:hypothetical protein
MGATGAASSDTGDGAVPAPGDDLGGETVAFCGRPDEEAMRMLWGILGGVAFVVLLVVWVITVSDMLRRHLGRGKTAAWLVIVILLPFAGSILYWVLRQPTAEEIQRQADDELALREEARRHGIDRTGVRP